MTLPHPRIVYLALADARGHLMRAHLLRGLLAPRGVDVEILTTSEAGQRFLAALGTPAEVLSSRFGMVFDARHNLRPHRTTARTLLYLVSPWGLWGDRRRLGARSRGAALVVSDSLHPALLLAPRGERVVQIYGENIRRATLEHFGGPVARVHRAVVERGLSRAFARLEHTLSPTPPTHGGPIRLPPIIPCPRAGSVPGERRRAVVYLNPHFRDEAIAEAIESAVHDRGLRLHAVGEGFAHREGWIPHDPHLVDAVASAALLITGAGMGALGMARAFGVPTVCLVARQPEQRANARQLRGDPRIAAILLPTAEPLTQVLARTMERVDAATIASRPHEPEAAAAQIQQRWVSTFLDLLARTEPPHPSPPSPRIH